MVAFYDFHFLIKARSTKDKLILFTLTETFALKAGQLYFIILIISRNDTQTPTSVAL